MAAQATALYRHRTGHWLPSDHAQVRGWVEQLLSRSQSLKDKPLHPVLQDFKALIDNNGLIRSLATEMFKEVPVTPPYNQDPTKFEPQIRSYDQMFECINVILGEGPQWYKSDDSDAMGLIGFPINAILDWPMGTASGYGFFTQPLVNVHWKAVLNQWAEFLSGPESRTVLDSVNGWTSPDALQVLADKGNDGVDHYTFDQLYKCDPSLQYHGFTSWDNFFIREFQDNVRPVASPDGVADPVPGDLDPTAVIVNACESTPCLRKENVQLRDTFWLKSQPYSLVDMLNGENTAGPFVGGQVYQAFLSALSYHRWHAPVSGTVISIENVPGTYYSENFYEGFANIANGEPKPDPNAPNNSQPYIAEVAARGIITIQADNENIGLMAIVYVGMCEVSSCEFFVETGDKITKGDQIGTFHFGGSTHCLVFRPETKLKFEDPGPYNEEANKKVNSCLAIVV
ncbi:MAG: hypothetical protein M1822_004432 [Bathelium mastoideum]|nr:MAG: hypothetical protein M1822_004432 [Bathelium mastoideum]